MKRLSFLQYQSNDTAFSVLCCTAVHRLQHHLTGCAPLPAYGTFDELPATISSSYSYTAPAFHPTSEFNARPLPLLSDQKRNSVAGR